MNFIDAILIVIVPFIPIILPGICFVNMRSTSRLLLNGSRIILWSMGSLTLLLTLGLFFQVSVEYVALFIALLSVAYAVRARKQMFTRQAIWQLLGISIVILLASAVFIIPFLFIQDGLPTGDIQKTIIWANESLSTNTLPDYNRAVEFLNRDPVDFYTPGLHAISALILSLSPSPLVSIGIFAIVIAICVAWITASITQELFDDHVHVVPPVLAALFVLTQFRFLRYLREPGYHFQNIVGELFLFGTILLAIRFLRRQEMKDAVLFIVCASALFLTHQFSAFIAAFVFVLMSVSCLFVFRKKVFQAIAHYPALSTFGSISIVMTILLLFSLGLGNKIPSIFTTTPHLKDLLLPLTSYPSTMGEFWLFSGVAGLILMGLDVKNRTIQQRQVGVFIAATIAIGLLSRGPAIGIDIPPVRALFYLAVPLSVSAAYLFGKLLYVIHRTYHGKRKQFAGIGLCIAIIISGYSSVYKAYTSLSHTVRTNSTLTGEQLGLIETLKNKKGRSNAILVDDYSRKSASWLVLADLPMFTRIGADVERQMEESNQSDLRKALYLNQIDYEKIVELGSLPQIATLFAKHNITYVTGTAHASQGAFAHNPLLQEVGAAEDVTLFEIRQPAERCASADCAFLLRPATLANDIGDDLDFFEYLQASIRSARVSDVRTIGNTTYRAITAPIIPLSFNVGDYVRVLWDINKVNTPESSLTFMLHLTRPVQGLLLRTPSGTEIPLPHQAHMTVEIPRDIVQINDKGFVSLSLINPRGSEVPIDLIALGLSLVP